MAGSGNCLRTSPLGAAARTLRVPSTFAAYIGAGSGIDRPDWMHAAVASVAAEAVGIEIDAKLAARARERAYA